MENFIVSARKYRPATFDTVVGQASITTTLKNAIKNNQLAHAYLFCGPRGVGKTTCARIFAKTINCSNITADYEACDKCESCVAFNKTSSYNIHELDAASNNSVEDIRSLIDQVRILPQIGKYSIYIIDEVHMLSTAAFNAFLKTLEEPPAHAIFILATTEKHKILPTIISRCQIFDFNRIRVNDTVNHLGKVAKNENIDADVNGLNVIAQKADGAMRDALSLFDQIVSFSGKKITYKDVIENLNVLDYDYYFKLIDAFLSNNYSEALLLFNKILNHGFDGHHFISGLSGHLRDILVCKDAVTIQLLEVGATIRENYKSQAANCPVQFLLSALEITNKCDLSYKTSSNQRLHVELALLKLCNITNPKKKDNTVSVEADTKTDKNNSSANNGKQANNNQNGTKPPRKITTFSLKDALAQPVRKKEEEKNIDKVNEPETEYSRSTNPFTEEQLQAKWKEYANSINAPSLTAALQAYPVKLANETIVKLQLDTKLSEDSFNREYKPKALNFLRRELENYKIEIETVVEKKNVRTKPFTESDKYKYLENINPELNTLKQKFQLDFNR